MGTNIKQFALSIQEFTKDRLPEEALLFQKKIVLEALRRIVLKTPVDTGRARGNWQVTIGVAPEGDGFWEEYDEKGEQTIAAGLSALAEVDPGQVVFISNNLKYIVPLEKGHSKQAPDGMVAVSIAEIQVVLAAALQRMRAAAGASA